MKRGWLAERRRRRQEAKEGKGPPKWQQTLSKGSARTTFVVGALLTLPGASYLIGLHKIADADPSTGGAGRRSPRASTRSCWCCSSCR